MPMRRKNVRRKPRTVLKGRRRVAVKRSSRQIHNYKRTALISQITASVTSAGLPTNIAGAYQFNLAQLPNVSEFGTLYDQYKITGAQLKFVPGMTESILSPLSGVTAPLSFNRFHSVIDYDDNTTPPDENTLLQYGSLKSTQGNRTHTRFIKPKVLQEIYRSAVATAYRPIGSQWLDMSYTDVPHYGIKVWCSAPNSSSACSITYNVYLTLYFACKNTR